MPGRRCCWEDGCQPGVRLLCPVRCIGTCACSLCQLAWLPLALTTSSVAPRLPPGTAELEARQRLSKLGMGGSRAAAPRSRPTAAAAPAAPQHAAAAPAPAAAVAKQGGGEGWGDDNGWEDMDSAPGSPPARGKPTLPLPLGGPAAGGGAAAGAGPRRPTGTRQAGLGAAPLRKTSGSGGSGGHGHAMKLGANKLGVSKLEAEFEEW